MLVLTRKTSQVIQLGEDITITVVRTSQGSVKLGIEAPRSLRVTRGDSMWHGTAHVPSPSGISGRNDG